MALQRGEIGATDPCWFTALPRQAFVAMGNACEACCLCTIATVAQISPESWTDLAKSFGLDPLELGVAAVNHRAFTIALVYAAHP